MIDKYVAKRAALREICWLNHRLQCPAGIVVIPAYDELDHLPVTLRSLAVIDPLEVKQCAVVCVVNNHSPDCVPAENRDYEAKAVLANQMLLGWLRQHAAEFPFALGVIDASSPGKELPGKAGVGLARKVGCDSAIHDLLRQGITSPSVLQSILLFHLDADAVVEPSYFATAQELTSRKTAGGSIRFEHLPASSPAGQLAIDCYELYMHHYVTGLTWAGSPYAFHTVGSCMVSSAGAYIRAGGMPGKRLAGEDFYFLQQLAKCGGVSQLSSTTVHPSPRLSARVPFGTGPRIREAVEKGDPFLVHDLRSFGVVRELQLAFRHPERLRDTVSGLPGSAQNFLDELGLWRVEKDFCTQFSDASQRKKAFDDWFDGLATYRLLHCLSTATWPSLPILEGWTQLMGTLARKRLPPFDSVGEALAWWRNHTTESMFPADA